MSKSVIKKNNLKIRRKRRVRAKISGSGDRPRLSVFRSAKHLYAQVIDDTAGKTLVSISSFEKGNGSKADVEACKSLGQKLAERCLAKDVSKVCFDKNGSMYHGRVKSFADGAREAGLSF